MTTTEFITTELIPIYAMIAISIFIIGLLWKFTRYGLNRLIMKREMNKRTRSIYPVKGNSFWKSFWEVNIGSFMKFWAKANPITFTGHVLYHFGLFIALSIYAFVAVISIDKIIAMPLGSVLYIFDWFAHTDEIFTGSLANLGEILVPLFMFGLICGTTGMAIPFIMSAIKKRGMIVPLDSVLKTRKVYTDGLPRSSMQGHWRKFMGGIVLIMDTAMLSTFFIELGEWAFIIHVIFGLTIMALFPFTFLFHEIYRMRAWSGVLRMMDGRVS